MREASDMQRVELSAEMTHRAPDGSEVRELAAAAAGTMAHFRLPVGETSVAKRHRSVEELWYFVGGQGEMCIGDVIAEVRPGVSVHIPVGHRFQFRTTGEEPLEAVAVTMPPWPGGDEAVDADPMWPS